MFRHSKGRHAAFTFAIAAAIAQPSIGEPVPRPPFRQDGVRSPAICSYETMTTAIDKSHPKPRESRCLPETIQRNSKGQVVASAELYEQPTLSMFARIALEDHNHERASVGAPPLSWNEELAKRAQEWANELARVHQLIHSPRAGRGTARENLASGPLGYTVSQLIELWSSEKSGFHRGTFPQVCEEDGACFHYTQEIWPTSEEMGCGMAEGGGYVWLDCLYDPGGNKDGKPVGMPVSYVEQPPLPPAEVTAKGATDNKTNSAFAGRAGSGRPNLSKEVAGRRVTPDIFERGKGDWLHTGKGDERDIFRGNGNGGFPSIDPVLEDAGHPAPQGAGSKSQAPDGDGKTPREAENTNQSVRPRPIGGDYGNEQVVQQVDQVPLDGPWWMGGETGRHRNGLWMLGGDFGDDDGLSGFIGGGAGIARVNSNNVRTFANQSAIVDDSDRAFISQVLDGGDVPTMVEQPALPDADQLFTPTFTLEPM